jgi:VWFA-related protein
MIPRDLTVSAIVGLLTLGSSGSLMPPLQSQDRQLVFRAARDVVRVEVSVRRNARLATDLTSTDFQVLDNGVAQTIADIGRETLPVDVTVVLDVSDSVSGDTLGQLRRAVDGLRDGLTASDRLKLVTFSNRIVRRVDFTPARELPRDAFRSIAAAGNTSIYDAAAVALVAASHPDRRQLVVLFSDGDDTASIVQPEVLLDVARRSSATAFVIVPQRARFSGGRQRQVHQSIFNSLARETGGMVVGVSVAGTLPDTFRRVLADFREMYVLHFSPRDVERRGVHILDVRVTRPGPYEVRARRGYVWD